MYDIHCHIFPDIDDGSGSIVDSVEMAMTAAESGVEGIIATPHCNIPGMYDNFWSSEFDSGIIKLNYELQKRKIPITVYSGQEIFAYGDIVDRLNKGELITLNNSDYVLVEFDFGTPEHTAYQTVQQLVAEGYKPVVAHPERYGFAYENPDSIGRLRMSGAFIQLNGDSISGNLGYRPMQVSKFILANRMADFVASDAHSQYSRTPNLSGAHEIVCSYFSYDYADIIFNDNPLKVINNKEIR